MDHEAVGKFHGLGTGSTKLSGNNHFTTLGTGLHNETQDTITSPDDGSAGRRGLIRTAALPADSEAVEKLVPQTFTLGNSRETTVLNLLSVHLERVFGEAEAFLNESGKFTDSTALLTQDFLGVGSTDNNLANHDIFRSPDSSST